MRAWMLMIGLVLSALFGGQAFAMSAHDCSRVAGTEAVSVVHGSGHATQHGAVKHGLPDDCCSNAGPCRMAGCAAVLVLPLPSMPPADTRAILLRPGSSAALQGLSLPPLLGPPRPRLS